MFFRPFIDRPILASVLSLLVTLAGGLAAFTLPVAPYPAIARFNHAHRPNIHLP